MMLRGGGRSVSSECILSTGRLTDPLLGVARGGLVSGDTDSTHPALRAPLLGGDLPHFGSLMVYLGGGAIAPSTTFLKFWGPV
jgi:hypothetical protein